MTRSVIDKFSLLFIRLTFLLPSIYLLPFGFFIPGMPVAVCYRVSVTTATRTTLRRVSVSANEMPENRTAFHFTSYHYAALPFVQGTPPSIIDSTLPLCNTTSRVLSLATRHFLSVFVYATILTSGLRFSFTAGFFRRIYLLHNLHFLRFAPRFRPDGGDRCCRCPYVFVLSVLAQLKCHPFK